MPLHAPLVEDDAHRVLQLVRGAKASAKATRPITKSTRSATRHRHQHVDRSAATSLAQAKTRALLAVYGVRPTAPLPLSPQRKDESDEVSEEQRREHLDARRRVYRNHFSGLQATYGPSGRPKLETLIDAAMDAKRASAKHTALAIGAAVLTSANRIFASGRVESMQDAKFDVCAERAALLKVLEHGDATVGVVEALVICSDQRGLLPVPCGPCREFLADFGDFPVFLLNADNDSRETRSFELFPLARHAAFTAIATQSHPINSPKRKSEQPLMDARDWTCEQVATWLTDVVELPQYAPVFLDKRVDGATLWHVADTDLQCLVGIVHPLHRRRVLAHLDRLRDRALLEHGIDFGQLSDYNAVLDRDRLDVVAQLKQTFDHLDANGDGRLDAAELARALASLGIETPDALAAEQLLSQAQNDANGVSFPAFVQTFSRLAQLPAGATCTNVVPPVDLDALRATFDRADTNHSGSLDTEELVTLLQSLGRDDAERRAREWFRAVDSDGDNRLSFAEFFQRYSQLTKVDLSVVRAAFDADAKAGTFEGLVRALIKLFPHQDAGDIRAWCQANATAKSLTYADFALVCVMYANALRLRVAHLQQLQQRLANEPMCHRSRIVQLQESGHVRLCKHPGGGEVPVGDERRRQQQRENQGKQEESKDNEEEEEEEDDDRVDSTFRRFAAAHKKRTRDDDDGKQQRSDEENDDDDDAVLHAVDAAQALLELGVAWSRDQLLRYLNRHGFGLRRTITLRDFRRLVTRLKAFQTTRRGHDTDVWDAISATKAKAKAVERREPSPSHSRCPQEYDAYLRTKHAQRKKQQSKETVETLRGRRRGRDNAMERSRRRAASSSSSSGSESDQRGRRRERQQSRTRSASRRHSRRSSESSSSGSSSDRRGRHRRTACFRNLVIGDRVAVRGRGVGTLVHIYRDYFVGDVRLDSGDRVKNVALSELTKAKREVVNETPLAVGASVRVAHKGTKTTRRGTIHRCRTNGTYDVVVHDVGNPELLVRVPRVQLSLEHKPVVYSNGTRVTVKRRHEYVRGVITMCRTNGTYDVRVRGRDVLERVAWELLAPDPADDESEEEEEEDERPQRFQSRKAESDDDGKEEDEDASKFRVGDHVAARFQGNAAFYRGRVTRVHRDGACDIAYDDGDIETRVRPQWIRPTNTKATAKDNDYDDDFEA